jgi:PhzF family phenazine biosynthesis protein
MTPEVLRYATATGDGTTNGDPAGVVLGAACLAGPELQAIAEAIGYPATAFVDDLPGSSKWSIAHRVRFLATDGEIPFSAHATVAAAVAISERAGVGPLLLETPAGPVRVRTEVDGGRIVATFTSPGGQLVSGTANWLPLSAYDELDQG